MSYTGMMELSEINTFFFDDSAVDVFFCDSLNSVGNKLESRMVVRMRCFSHYDFEDCCIVRGCVEFVSGGGDSIITCS